MKLVEFEKNRWRVARNTRPAARSELPLPYVISDTMDPTEQVDGRYYTSKAAFRRVGRSLGLTEVGTAQFKPKKRSTDLPEVKAARRQAIKKAVQIVRGV